VREVHEVHEVHEVDEVYEVYEACEVCEVCPRRLGGESYLYTPLVSSTLFASDNGRLLYSQTQQNETRRAHGRDGRGTKLQFTNVLVTFSSTRKNWSKDDGRKIELRKIISRKETLLIFTFSLALEGRDA
jgi:hypothetical protein